MLKQLLRQHACQALWFPQGRCTLRSCSCTSFRLASQAIEPWVLNGSLCHQTLCRIALKQLVQEVHALGAQFGEGLQVEGDVANGHSTHDVIQRA